MVLKHAPHSQVVSEAMKITEHFHALSQNSLCILLEDLELAES